MLCTWFCARRLADSGIMNTLALPSLQGRQAGGAGAGIGSDSCVLCTGCAVLCCSALYCAEELALADNCHRCDATAAMASAHSGCPCALPYCLPAHRLMVGLWAPQLLHLPPVGCFLKKSEMVAIIASSV